MAAAEELFALHGFAAVSLRQITASAGTNVAAVQYHFKNKEGLVASVLNRCMLPITERITIRLEECRNAAGGATPKVEAVLRAYIEGWLESLLGTDGHVVSELVRRATNDPDPFVSKLANRNFDNIWKLFGPLMEQALPHLSKEEVYWRLYFVLADIQRVGQRHAFYRIRSQGLCDTNDVRRAAAEMLAYSLAGLTTASRSGRPPQGAAISNNLSISPYRLATQPMPQNRKARAVR